MARGFVLTFHSHNVAGSTYATNDHVALDESLELLTRWQVPVLPLIAVVRRLLSGPFDRLPERFVCLTFDDGSDYDWRDLEFGEHGLQPSMFSILRKHSTRIFGPWWLRRAPATSFVIANDAARRDISLSAFGDAERMSNYWWRAAQDSGLMEIGSHGWDHVHPAVRALGDRPELLENFHRISTAEEGLMHVQSACQVIRRVAGRGSAKLFAYPYGQVSEYLAMEYLPQQHEVLAAVAAVPRPFDAQADRWRIPRYVCGHDWKSAEDLRSLLGGA